MGNNNQTKEIIKAEEFIIKLFAEELAEFGVLQNVEKWIETKAV